MADPSQINWTRPTVKVRGQGHVAPRGKKGPQKNCKGGERLKPPGDRGKTAAAQSLLVIRVGGGRGPFVVKMQKERTRHAKGS